MTSNVTVPVAPYVGAWIETSNTAAASANQCVSLPMWERGLKQLTADSLETDCKSLPMWERGLKHDVRTVVENMHCRSLCGSVD